MEENNPVVLNYEEYETIRLSDFELYGQVEAALIMDVSRPTYARIYESARRKVAQAFVGGKAILFEGGKVYFTSEWFSCNNCGCWFNYQARGLEVKKCALCGSSDVVQYTEDSEPIDTEDICICPQCGEEKAHTPGIPCKKEICPKCNCPMIREGAPHRYRMRNNN